MAEHFDIALGGALMKPLHRTIVTGAFAQAGNQATTGSTSCEPGQRHRPPESALRHMLV
ncbi:hypothetical protein [Mycolicibacterium setense]|uniref:hypothetical protein n=1 Tax=Mycolicibacterium setense TaxID=431269 RepID=UPI001F441136|nr:hypothetical protein [Mycolicibacterium setense]